jgi:hypothetical protein
VVWSHSLRCIGCGVLSSATACVLPLVAERWLNAWLLQSWKRGAAIARFRRMEQIAACVEMGVRLLLCWAGWK